jgi:hypothetical protein
MVLGGHVVDKSSVPSPRSPYRDASSEQVTLPASKLAALQGEYTYEASDLGH